MARVTLHDVALEAGVSDSTVSRSLRGLDKVDERTRERVREAAQRLRFSFSRNASSLASGKNMRVALLFSDALNTWFDSSVLQGAYEVLFPERYDLIPSTVDTRVRLDDFFDRLPTDGNVDALLVASINLDQRQTDILKRLTIPTVGIDSRTIEGFDASVLEDDQAGICDAVRLLKNLGHQHIAFMGWPEPGDFEFSMKQRVSAFINAAQRLGYEEKDIQHFDLGKLSDYRNKEDALSTAVARILAADPRPTGICVEADGFAVPLMGRLRSLGIRIPEDMSVIGFDDTDVAAAVGLTTIHQDPLEMSRDASRKALALMRGLELEKPHTLMKPTLVVRSTTAHAPSC